MVLVFVVVLSVTMLVATSLGWTDMRVVTTIRDEKSAARIAEAGIAEGLKRLSMTAQSSVSVDGDTFDPSFAAAAGHTDCTQTTDLCPDVTNVNWTANIHLGTGGTSKSANVVTTRTIQTSSDRVIYGNTTAGTNPDDGDLTIRWNCTDSTGLLPAVPDCSASGARIRHLFNMPVIDVIATGYYPSRDHPNAATRKMTVSVIPGVPGLGAYKTSCPPSGVDMVGNVQVSVQGSVQIDSPCNGGAHGYAINGNGGTLVQTGGQMNVVGDVSSGHATSPDLNTGAPSQPDPLGPNRADLLRPCFGTIVSSCFNITAEYGAPVIRGPGSPSNPVVYSPANNTNLQPGIYYGGFDISSHVTFSPGIYIIAGGGLAYGQGSTRIDNTTGGVGGVMIFNTQNDYGPTGPPGANCGSGNALCTIGSIVGQGNPQINLNAPRSGYYQGVVIFEARSSDGISPADETAAVLDLQGGNNNNSSLDGLIYAVDTNLNFQGGINVSGNIIVGSMTANGNVNIGGTATTSPKIAEKAGFTQIVAWKDY
jgi:hypothetical protein